MLGVIAEEIKIYTSTTYFEKQPPEVFYKKGVLKNFAKFTGKHQCQSLFFNKKETLAQVFSCEYCEIFKNTFYAEHLRVTASVR